MKKLLYIANLRLPTEKAYGIQITKMCEALGEILDVELIAPYRKNNIKEGVFDYYGVKRNFKFNRIWAPDFYLPGVFDKIAVFIKSAISALGLAFYALKQNPDIVYSRDELPLYFLSFFKKNLFFEAHRFSKLRKLFYKRFKNKNFKIIVITNHLKDDFIKIGFLPESILVAPDGVDLAEFDIQISKNEAREKFFGNIHNEHFARKKIAVYIGHLYSWKGASVDMFSETAKYICEKNPNFLISIFGGTDNELKKFRNELKKIHPNLVPMIYLGGRVPHKDVPYILKAADCAILTGNESDTISLKYTSPLKMFEYMASGCPIVAQNLPSFREVLNDKNSFLVKPGDARALADKISWVFEEKNLKTVEGKAVKALEDVKNYTWQKRADKIYNFSKS